MKKKSLLLLITVLFFINYSYAQWTCYPASSGGWESMYFFNANNGIMSTAFELVTTGNGGQTWGSVNYQNMRDIDFPGGGSTGWAAGTIGMIGKSTNGGASWTTINAPTTNSLWGVSAPTANVVYMCGTGGVVWKTINGNTFYDYSPPTTSTLIDIYFVSTTEGYVVTDNGNIWKTVNGGNLWTNVYTGGSYFNSIYFPTVSEGFAVSTGGKILRTQDAGAHWTVTIPANIPWQYVHFYDANNGMVVGYGGKVMRTTNGGDTWFYENLNTTVNLKSCILLSATSAIIAGDTIAVFKNTNLVNAVHEPDPLKVISMYPNPAAHYFTIENAPVNARMDIYDLTGTKVYAATLPSQKTTIDLNGFAVGIYLVRIGTDKNTVVRKLVVE